MRRRLGILSVIIIVGLLATSAWGYLVDYSEKYRARTCTDQTVAYTSSTVNDPNTNVGTNTTTTSGATGIRSVCVNGFGTVMSETVTKQPTNEVIAHGTKPLAPSGPYMPAPAPDYGGGAICNDGWRSYSTGRGTCSHHGGIDYYL